MGCAILAGISSFGIGLALQYCLIALQRRFHVSQVQKSYGVGIDIQIKSSTPTMGGLVFILGAFIVMGVQRDAEAFLFWSLPVLCGFIGLADDWLKFSKKSSEGFSSLRKLYAQLVAASFWSIWASLQCGLAPWPGIEWPAWLTVPATILAAVGMMNAVNVTDGLDALAGGAFFISLGVLGGLSAGLDFLLPEFAVLLGMIASFLLYNVRPARIFMGDTGSHFLGGALVVLCVRGEMILALIPAGFLFGLELFSSAVQIAAIRKFGRKIFKMAPLHHHFQRMGWDETTVTLRFLVVHAVGSILLAALGVYLWGLGR